MDLQVFSRLKFLPRQPEKVDFDKRPEESETAAMGMSWGKYST